jgi:hypothetical protein
VTAAAVAVVAAIAAVIKMAVAMQRRAKVLSKTRVRKRSGRFYEMPFGARSAAGSMTPLSPRLNVREHRFQMHHYRDCAGDPLSRGGEPLSFAYLFFAAAKKSRCRPAQGQR